MEENKINTSIMKPIEIDPPEIVFANVDHSKVYRSTFKLTNNYKFLITVKFKTSANDKLDIKPLD